MNDADFVTGRTYGGRTYRRFAKCKGCGAKLVPQREWNRSSIDRRSALLKSGHRKQGIGPYCALKACQDERARSEVADG